jgi:hypothetical protein
MDIQQEPRIFSYFGTLGSYGQMIFTPERTTLNEIFSYLDKTTYIHREVVRLSFSIQELLNLIETNTRFDKFHYCLTDSNLRSAFGVGLTLVYGGMCDPSLDLGECCRLTNMVAELVMSDHWDSIEYKIMTGVPEPSARDYLRTVRVCGAIAKYSMDYTVHVRHPVIQVGLQSTYILQDYFGSPANSGTLDTHEVKLLEDCKEAFKKMSVSRELIKFEKYFQTDCPDTRTRDFLNNRELS